MLVTIARVGVPWTRVAGLLVVVAAVAAARGDQLPASPSSTAAAPVEIQRSERARPPSTLPGAANLDRALAGALRRAAADAAGDGVELRVKSGWRSRGQQEQPT